jgi:hypothetical protein
MKDKSNETRGDAAPDVTMGEAGGPAGVERGGGKRAKPPRTGVPEGMTPGDLQISPEEKREIDSDDWR